MSCYGYPGRQGCVHKPKQKRIREGLFWICIWIDLALYLCKYQGGMAVECWELLYEESGERNDRRKIV